MVLAVVKCKYKGTDMKHIIIILLSLLIAVTMFGMSQIELVESIPIETSLDNEDIRNTSEVWIEMISSAKKSLDFGEFYISHKEGESLSPILNAIYEAADRGVKVRFIVDGNMYKTYPETADKLKEHENIDVHVYNLSEITGGVLHAKYFIVDGKEIFIGSQNFDWRALTHIHELGIRINNASLTKFYNELFELDWLLSSENANTDSLLKNIEFSDKKYRVSQRDKKHRKSLLIPTASNPKIIYHKENWDETQLLEMIEKAKEKIQIQLLSYSLQSRGKPYNVLDNALRSAAARGIKVEMILSDWNFYSPRIENIKSLHSVPNIDIKFSTIPEASTGYVGFARVEHCKFMVIDNKEFWLGTSNWSESYFYKGRNIGIIVKNKKLATRVSQKFYKSWDSEYCKRVDLEKEYKRKKTSE